MLKILDRYILKKFLNTFFFSITLILMIFIVFDIKEKIQTYTTKDIEEDGLDVEVVVLD